MLSILILYLILIFLIKVISSQDINNEFLQSDTGRYIVVVSNRLGLANRLRVVADWLQVARITNRTVLLSWEPKSDCNISFTELFEKVPDDLKLLPFFYPGGDEGKAYMTQLTKERGMSYAFIDNKEYWRSTGFVLDENLLKSDIQVLLSYYDGVLTMEGVPCQYYLAQRSKILLSFVPVENARNIINDIMVNYFNDKMMISVHIREHDPLFDWEVVPPLGNTADGQPRSASKFGEGLTLNDFVDVMRKIEAKLSYKSNGQITHFHKFYIASNSVTVKETMLQIFPSAVSLNSDDYSRQTTTGVFFAFIEWLLIAQSSLIINTHGSSFAVEAATINMRPVVGLWSGVLVHHTNSQLPYCGHFQFMKAYGQQGWNTVYHEGTYDNRKIDAKVFSLKRCSLFEEWGLSEVYCSVSDSDANR